MTLTRQTPTLISTTDVLVVGAGPTGLMMAMELAARGVRCMIIDQLVLPSDKSRALVVQPRTLEILQKHGLAHKLIEQGRPTLKASVYVKRREVVQAELGDIGVDDSPFPFLLFVSQCETERILRDQLLAAAGFGVVLRHGTSTRRWLCRSWRG